MTNRGQKSTAASSDSLEKGGSVTEIAGTRGLDGATSAGKEKDEGTLVPALDTTCSNEQLLSLRTSIESGFTIMGDSLTKAMKDCFSHIADKFENNLLAPEESDQELSEREEPTGEKQKERENPSIESLLDSRGKAADKETGKASHEDPKSAVLDSIKQDIKADEVGDSIDSELSAIVTSLLTKGMADDKLQEKMNRTARPQSQSTHMG